MKKESEPTKRKAEVHGRRWVFTYMYLLSGLQLVMEQITDKRAHCMTAILYCAFALEAYINHVGANTFKEHVWNAVTRKPTRSKLALILTELDKRIEFGEDPFTYFKPLFDFRNLLVHGKTAVLEYSPTQYLEAGKAPVEPLTEWEERLTIKDARLFYEKTKAMMEVIHELAGLEHDLYTFPSVGTWSMT